jgi:hypothetical protein
MQDAILHAGTIHHALVAKVDDLLRNTDPPVRQRPVRCKRSPHAEPSPGASAVPE